MRTVTRNQDDDKERQYLESMFQDHHALHLTATKLFKRSCDKINQNTLLYQLIKEQSL